MTKRNIILTVILTILAVVILAGAGYALYRWGYARGVAASPCEMGHVWGGEESGDFDMPHLGYRLRLDRWRGISPLFGRHMGYAGFPFFGGFIAFLLFGGLIALAVFGVISLVRKK